MTSSLTSFHVSNLQCQLYHGIAHVRKPGKGIRGNRHQQPREQD